MYTWADLDIFCIYFQYASYKPDKDDDGKTVTCKFYFASRESIYDEDKETMSVRCKLINLCSFLRSFVLCYIHHDLKRFGNSEIFCWQNASPGYSTFYFYMSTKATSNNIICNTPNATK